MIRAITPDSMRSLEERFMRDTGVPSLLLMEHAAIAVVGALEGACRALFVCGPGSNGGDGMAAARLFSARGGHPNVWLTTHAAELRGDALAQYRMLAAMGIKPMEVTLDDLPAIPPVDWIVDAMFGTGLARPLAGVCRAIASVIGASPIPVLAVDIPSGVDSASGKDLGGALRARRTVTFHAPKLGHYLYPGRELTGELIVAPIGIPNTYGDSSIYADIITDSDIQHFLPPRKPDTHKSDYGHVLVIAGSLGMAGAAAFCAQAAVKSGAGLTTIACPADIIPIIQTLVPSATALPLADAHALAAALAGKKAVAVGPGLSRNLKLLDTLQPLYSCGLPQVWDADALNLLADSGLTPPLHSVITPHPGEASRLLGICLHDILNDPVSCARELSRRTGAVALLKGAATVVAHSGRLAINTSGCPAMAKGGSGDILTGLIAALLAQGLDAFDAACLGAHLHGRAGEGAAALLGERAATPPDIIAQL